MTGHLLACLEVSLPIRLLALDLDGTIIDSRMRVSPRVRRALRSAVDAGVHVILASGRFFRTVRLFAQDLGIEEPLICYQGALIQDPNSAQVYFKRGVPLHLAGEFVNFVQEHGWDLGICIDDCIYAQHDATRLRFYAEYSPVENELQLVDDLRSILSSEPLKLVVVTEEEQAAMVRDMLQERFAGRLRIMRSFSQFVEGTSLEASKGRALAFLAGRLGATQAETMAIGDNDNDVDMVAWAGLGVAMGNASAAVKAVADYVAPSLEEDGAAEAIERFILS